MHLREGISAPFVEEKLVANAVWGSAPTDVIAGDIPGYPGLSPPPDEARR